MTLRDTTEQEFKQARQRPDEFKERSQQEVAAINGLWSAMERYRLNGGRVTILPALAMQDSESKQAQRQRTKHLRNYKPETVTGNP